MRLFFLSLFVHIPLSRSRREPEGLRVVGSALRSRNLSQRGLASKRASAQSLQNYSRKKSLKMALNHWAGTDCNRRRTTLTRTIPDGAVLFRALILGSIACLRPRICSFFIGQACPERSSKQKTPCNSIVKHRVSHANTIASESLEVNRWVTDCSSKISSDLPGLRIRQLSSRIIDSGVQITSRVV